MVELKEFMIVKSSNCGYGVLIKDNVWDFRIVYCEGGGQIFNIEDTEKYINEIYECYEARSNGDIKYYALQFFANPALSSSLSNYKKIYDKKDVQKKFNEEEIKIPNIRDKIYVTTSLYIGDGENDVIGGLATVNKIEERNDIVWIDVKEHPGLTYNWNYLKGQQEKLKEKFKDRVAYTDPDYNDYGDR